MTSHPSYPKRNQLRKLKFSLVSLVDNPDNPTAQVTFYKRAGFEDGQNLSAAPSSHTAGGMPNKQPSPDEGTISKGALPDGLPADVQAYIHQLEDIVLKAAAAVDDVDVDELTDEDYDELVAGFEDEVDPDEVDDEDFEPEDYDEEPDDEGVEKSLDAILKGADPRIVAILKQQEDRLAEAEEIAKRERDARMEVEFTKMAAQLPNVAEAKPLGTLLRKAAEAMEPGDFRALHTILTKANQRLQEGDLFREIGRSGSEWGHSTGRLDEVIKAAQAAGPDATPEQRIWKALEADKAAYDEFNAEFMGGKGR